MKRLIYLLMLVFFTLPALTNGQQNCYEVRESNTGIGSLYAGLDARACELLDVIPGYDFSVVGYDFYPVLVYTSQVDRFNALFDNAVAVLDAEKESYGLVTKSHNTDGTITYRTHIKFPTTGNFANLTPFEKEGINELFSAEIDKLANASFGVGNSVPSWPEEGGWITLASIFGDIMGDSLDLGGALMELAGFDSAPVDAGESFSYSSTSATGAPYTPNNGQAGNLVYDFTGLESNGEILKEKLSIDIDPVNDDDGVLHPFGSMISLSHAYILTDHNNTRAQLSRAKEIFDSTTQKIIVWMHFDLNQVGIHEATDSVYVKYEDNIDEEEAEAIVNEMFNHFMSKWLPELYESVPGYRDNPEAVIRAMTNLDCDGNAQNCGLSWKWGAHCLLPSVGEDGQWVMGSEFALGLAIGLFDGLLGTVQVFFEAGKGLIDLQVGFWRSVYNYTKELVQTAIAKRSLLAVCKKVLGDAKDVVRQIKKGWDTVVQTFKTLKELISNLTWDTVRAIVDNVWIGIVTWMGDLLDGDKCPAYQVGVLLFDVLITVFTSGAGTGAKFLPKMLQFVKKLSSRPQKMISDLFDTVNKDLITAANNPATREFAEEAADKVSWCKVIGGGCFVAGTPVLMANPSNVVSLKDSVKILAVAASMPIIAIPIEEVQLLDYAVAHKTVNEVDNLTASLDETDTYLGLLEHDPYTSDEQRQRDDYQLDNENWNEVVFEEVYGSSVAKFALHTEWISKKGYHEDAIIQMNLPEQGISGLFRITSIKHILPQKRPLDEDEADDYDYRPVTGLITHNSNRIHHVSFDNGEQLEVTYRHPIYSVTAADWRLAGKLEIGEKVLARSGELTVESNIRLDDTQTVYNLEVQELHNFLTGESGIVVHNTYNLINKVLRKVTTTLRKKAYLKIGTKREANILGAKSLGLTKEDDWLKFADGVKSKDIDKLEELGFNVRNLDNGSLSIEKGNKRYRTPVKKASQNDAVSANIEVKPDNLTWQDVDTRPVIRDQIAYNNIRVKNPDKQ